jgi:hypothetical protein
MLRNRQINLTCAYKFTGHANLQALCYASLNLDLMIPHLRLLTHVFRQKQVPDGSDLVPSPTEPSQEPSQEPGSQAGDGCSIDVHRGLLGQHQSKIQVSIFGHPVLAVFWSMVGVSPHPRRRGLLGTIQNYQDESPMGVVLALSATHCHVDRMCKNSIIVQVKIRSRRS